MPFIFHGALVGAGSLWLRVLDYCLAWMVGSLHPGPSSRGVTQHIIPPSLWMDDMDDIVKCNSRPAIEVNLDWSSQLINLREDTHIQRARITMWQSELKTVSNINTNPPADFKSLHSRTFYTYSQSPSHITTLLWWRWKKEPLWSLIMTFAKGAYNSPHLSKKLQDDMIDNWGWYQKTFVNSILVGWELWKEARGTTSTLFSYLEWGQQQLDD